MNVRRMAAAWLVILLTGLAPGCASHMVDVNRRVLAFALGFDEGKEPGTVRLSLQYFRTSPPSGQDQPGGRQPVIVTAEAPTLGEAWAEMGKQVPGELYGGTVQIIAVGKSLAEAGIRKGVDVLLRHPAMPSNAHVVIADDNAETLLRAKIKGHNSVAGFIRNMFSGAEKRRTELWRLYDGSMHSWRTTFVPVIEATDEGVKMTGYGVFQGDRLARTLTPPASELLIATRGFLLVAVTVDSAREPKGPITVRLTTPRIKARLGPDGSTAQVDVISQGVLIEGPKVHLTGEMEQELQRRLATDIERRVRAVLEELYADGIDVLNLSEQARRRTPDGTAPRDWPEQARKVRLQVRSAVKIMHGRRGR